MVKFPDGFRYRPSRTVLGILGFNHQLLRSCSSASTGGSARFVGLVSDPWSLGRRDRRPRGPGRDRRSLGPVGEIRGGIKSETGGRLVRVGETRGRLLGWCSFARSIDRTQNASAEEAPEPGNASTVRTICSRLGNDERLADQRFAVGCEIGGAADLNARARRSPVLRS